MGNRASAPIVPDVHGKATVESLAVTTVVIYLASLAGLDIPGAVGAAITTLAGVGFGIIRGRGYSQQERRDDV